MEDIGMQCCDTKFAYSKCSQHNIERHMRVELLMLTETLCRLPNPRARKVPSSRGQGHHRAAQQRSAGENDSYVSASLYPDLSALTDSSDASSAGSYENGLHAASDPSVLEGCTEEEMNEPNWRHLLLIIPLRLGLSEMNLVYADALRVLYCFRLLC
jgi:hypothetical protein